MSTTPETPPVQQAITPYIDSGEADLMWSSAGFEHAQRLAKLFSSSVLVPDHLRGKVADVTIALLMARRLNEDPLVVMQNIHVIHGRAGWSAQYIVARANRSGVFRGRIGWRQEGKGEDLAVTAHATLAETGEAVEFTVGMKMAKGEGWTSNKKYTTMPELMLRYRSATFLVRLYAPEVMLGIPTSDELDDAPPVTRPAIGGELGALGLQARTVDAEEVPPAVVLPAAVAPAPQAPARAPRAPRAPKPPDPPPAEPTPAQRQAFEEQLTADIAKGRVRRALLDRVAKGIEQLGAATSEAVAKECGVDMAVLTGPMGTGGLSDEDLGKYADALDAQVDRALADVLGEQGE